MSYAVIGGNAVAAWVATIDEAAVRFTRDVDILLRRTDPPHAAHALDRAGLCVSPEDGTLRVRDAVHIVFAGEKVRSRDALPNPDVADVVVMDACRVLSLADLAQSKLSVFRAVDATHLRDVIEVGLIDATWVGRFPPAIASRLQSLTDDPDG